MSYTTFTAKTRVLAKKTQKQAFLYWEVNQRTSKRHTSDRNEPKTRIWGHHKDFQMESYLLLHPELEVNVEQQKNNALSYINRVSLQRFTPLLATIASSYLIHLHVNINSHSIIFDE